MSRSTTENAEPVPHVCVVAPNAIAAVFPEFGTVVGGAETRAWTIAKELQHSGKCRVTFVIRSFRKLPSDEVTGVRILRQPDWFPELRSRVSECLERQSGFPGVRLLKFRLSLLWEVPFLFLSRPFRPAEPEPQQVDPVLMKVQPDAFLVFGTSADSSIVIATALQLGVPAILMLRSNADIPSEKSGIDRYGESRQNQAYVLHQASVVFSQSEFQKVKLKEQMGIDSELLLNPIDLSDWPIGDCNNGEYVLWVGRADRFHKRPQLLIELARRCPEIPFLLVMNRQDSEVYDEILRILPANVTHRDYVPFDQMPEVFRKARVFVSTGNPEYEGFPNVMLQAAAVGVPIVSMHDYDAFLTSSRSGVVTGEDLNELTGELRRVWGGSRDDIADVIQVRKYLNQHHSLESYCQRLLCAIVD